MRGRLHTALPGGGGDASPYNATPRTFGLIGDPVEHSLSPAIHNAAFAAHRIPAVYLRLHVRPRDLRHVVMAATLADIEGFNVTTPHKQAIIPYLDQLDQSATDAGAVNTVYRRRHRWIGANTDGVGFAAACARRRVTLTGKTVTILGAGGAARGIAAALLTAGVKKMILLNRTKARARALQKKCAQKSRVEIESAGLAPAAIRRYFPETDILIHATSQGLSQAPALSLPLKSLPRHAVVCDCQYHPSRSTALITRAQRMGHRTVDGLDLLLGQAAASYRLWIRRPAPFPAMRRAAFKNTRPR